jgi:hypothetical protein
VSLKGAWILGAFVLLVGTACDNDVALRAAPAAAVNSQASNTMQLSIKLRDGFRDDAVNIRVDGVEVYRKSAVSTDLTISFADKVEVPVQPARVSVEVSIARGATGRVEVSPGETPFIDVAIVDGVMTLRASKTETPML